MDESLDLEHEALRRLHDLGGDDLLSRMIHLFLDGVPKRLEAVRGGVAAGDAKAIELAAHSLKSSAGNLGTLRLQRLARALERRAHDGESTTLAVDSTALDAAFATASGLLRAELGRLNP